MCREVKYRKNISKKILLSIRKSIVMIRYYQGKIKGEFDVEIDDDEILNPSICLVFVFKYISENVKFDHF